MNFFGYVREQLTEKEFLSARDKVIKAICDRTLALPNPVAPKLYGHHYTRAVLGQDKPFFPQEIGDCTSFGGANALNYAQCYEIHKDLSPQTFAPVFPPFIYHCSRVLVGKNKINGDGSLGIWTAEAVAKYGILPANAPNVPPYSGRIAKLWGSPNSVNLVKEFYSIAAQHTADVTVVPIETGEDLDLHLSNGAFVGTASMQGFRQQVNQDGFHEPEGTWAHMMCIYAFNNTYKTPFYLIENQWPMDFGTLRDFENDTDILPRCTLRVRKEVVIRRMLSAKDTFAYYNTRGFVQKPLNPTPVAV